MKFPSWLNALKPGPSHRPFRRMESARSRGNPAGKLFVETLEARTVPAFLAPVDYPIGTYPIGVISADFDGDSVPDLATANYYAHQVSVFLGNPDGSLQAALNASTGDYPISLAVGDFNRDGDLDLATANNSGVSVNLGNGDGTFDAPTTIGLGSNATSVAVGDFDGDGFLDLGATTNQFFIDYWGYYGYYGHYEGRANVVLGNGDGSFAGPLTTELGYGSHMGAAAADFNGDGQDDFAAVDGNSLLKVALANPDGSLQAPDSYGTDWYSARVAVGDLNSDGISDLVTSNSYGVSVLLGNGSAGTGDGTFQTARSTNLGAYVSSVATGDFNDDEKLDLGVSATRWVIDGYGYYGTYGHYENEAVVLLGYDNGHFVAPETTSLGPNWGTGIASGDFNGDGFDDLALTNNGNYMLSVLINDETRTPLPPPAVSISNATIVEGHTGSTSATSPSASRSPTPMTSPSTTQPPTAAQPPAATTPPSRATSPSREARRASRFPSRFTATARANGTSRLP